MKRNGRWKRKRNGHHPFHCRQIKELIDICIAKKRTDPLVPLLRLAFRCAKCRNLFRQITTRFPDFFDRTSFSDLKGRAAEEHFYASMGSVNGNRPPWFLGVRRASKQEDWNGIDGFIDTKPWGSVPVNIKSSKGHEEEYEERGILVIVVNLRMPESRIQRRVFGRVASFCASSDTQVVYS